MKKLTTRLLSLVVALCVLMTSAAFAEADALASGNNMATLTIGNFNLSMDDQAVTLPVYLSLSGGADIENERGSLVLSLSTADQTAAAIYGALENGQLKAYVDGMDYGFVLPLEEVMQQLEAELDTAMADLGEQIPESMQTAVINLMTSAAELTEEEESLDLDALLNAWGVAYENNGTAEVTILGETVAAESATLTTQTQTMAELINALSAASPAFANYWSSYTELFDTLLVQSGEEITLEEALSVMTIGLNGALYATETQALAELTLTMTVEDETIVLPLTIAALGETDHTVVDVSLKFDADGDMVELNVLANEALIEGVSNAYTMFSMSILDGETEEVEESFSFTVSASDSDEESYLGMELAFNDGIDAYTMGFEYFGQPQAVNAQGEVSYAGLLGLYVYGEDEQYNLSMDTLLTLSQLPEGELLTLPENSIDVMQMTDEQAEALESDIQVPVMQAMGVLMQDETISALLAGMME